MSLAALIIVDEDKAGADLSVFGMPLVEYQARLAQASAANHIVVVTAQVPASLVAALDRLRGRGLNVVLARTAIEAAGQVHPDETVLLFEPGCLPQQAVVDRLAQAGKCAIVTVPFNPELRHQELIDAEHGWAGIACINGALVRQAAELPGDWSLASALLRFAVQAGAERIALGDTADLQVHHLTSGAEAAAATQAIVGGVTLLDTGFSGSVALPASAFLARQLARFALPPVAIDAVSLLLLTFVIGLGLAGWTATALLCFIPAGIVALVAQRLDMAALAASPVPAFLRKVLPWAGRFLLVMAGSRMVSDGEGWGALVLSAWLIWELLLAGKPEDRFNADEGSATLLTGMGLAVGFPLIGLGLALAHSLADNIRKG